jgi:DNA-binding MarR family transcriptional regulator
MMVELVAQAILSPVRPHLLEFHRLDPDERAAWLGFLRVYASIVRELDGELERAHGLSLSSYDVLVQLSIAPGDEMRMSELAEAALLSRAGITRLVERLERDGLVERRHGERDSRQVFAHITERGLERLAASAPTHFAEVRGRFLAPLTRPQKRAMADAWQRILGCGAAAAGGGLLRR